jgi:hypothetical protein
MGRIQSWDDFEPEERDYFANRHNRAGQENDNLRDTHDVQRNLEEAIQEVRAVRFAEVLGILIEKEIFQ